MDPISQGALGAAVTLAAWGDDKRLPTRVVAWLGALSAMAPDLDVLIRSSTDSFVSVEYHRHFTHSLAFVPLGPAIALLAWLVRRDVKEQLRFAYLLSFSGYLTHAALDCLTTFGTQWLWPFSNHRVALSWVSVVDPIYTVPLLVFVILAARKGAAKWARLGLALSCFYLILGGVQKARVSAVQAEIIASRGHVPVRRDVFTTFMNQVTWRSAYEADGRIYLDQIRVPYIGTRCSKAGESVEVVGPPQAGLGPRALRGHRLVRWFSSGWVAYSTTDPTLLGDLRYSFLPYQAEPFWGLRVNEESDTAEWVNTRQERRATFSAVIDLIFKNPPGSICH